MKDFPHVLIFDSGVGGLSVAREVLKAYPQCRLTYASDNAQFPYGTKPTAVLLERVERVIGCLTASETPDIIVIACNTASTLTLPRLRERYEVPFVGVVPAIKPAARISRTGVLGILATPATVARPYTQQLIKDHAEHCSVLLHGSHDLVQQAENKLQGLPVDEATIASELKQLIERPEAAALDTIVLACTHFPLLQRELEAAAGSRRFQWIDSGEAIARRVGYWIAQLDRQTANYPGQHQLALTAQSDTWESLQANLHEYFGRKNGTEFTIIPVD